MYGLRNSGLGDVLNPTAGTALDCGFFAGGVFKKECWCLEHPTWCSQADYVAARAMADPSVYDTLRQPPVVKAPDETLPPASGEQAQETIDALIAQQNAEWKAQNLESMRETQSGLDRFAGEYQKLISESGIPWWMWLAGGLGVFALVAVSGGSPRRYGR